MPSEGIRTRNPSSQEDIDLPANGFSICTSNITFQIKKGEMVGSYITYGIQNYVVPENGNFAL
jgi:hypothetical protein